MFSVRADAGGLVQRKQYISGEGCSGGPERRCMDVERVGWIHCGDPLKGKEESVFSSKTRHAEQHVYSTSFSQKQPGELRAAFSSRSW